MKTKLLGVALMSSALLLQVGYAATTTEYTLNNTQAFDVYFTNPVIISATSGIQVKLTEGESSDKGSLDIQVGNMYPGAEFEFETTIQNDGNTDARVVDILMSVQEKGTGGTLEYNAELMDMLVGYDETNKDYVTLEEYTTYLVDTYEDEVIEQGETLPIHFKMAMKEDEVGRQNQEVAFSMTLQFAQVQTGGGSGGSGGSSGGNGGGNSGGNTGTPDPTPPTPTPEEGPGDVPEVDIPDEGIPGGSTGTTPGVDIPEVTTPEVDVPEVDIPDEKVPGGPKLPQTGGLTPYIVYGAGTLMMLSGILCYRKKETSK